MKILIVSVSAGAGHTRAAEALQAALRKNHPSVDTLHVDLMDYVPAFFRAIYVKGYLFTVKHLSPVWGFLYGLTDKAQKPSPTQGFLDSVQRQFAGRFIRFVRDVNPDLVLTTHFLTAPFLSSEIKSGRLRAPLQCVVTDFDVHWFWINPVISHYYVASDNVAAKLTKRRIDPSRVTVTGIPIHPVFSEATNAETLRSKLGLKQGSTIQGSTTRGSKTHGSKTLLLLSGGCGLGAVEEAARALFDLNTHVHLITVAGRNLALLDRMNRLRPPASLSMTNLGFIDNIHEWLSVCDLVITKGGGLSVSECLAKEAPMVIFDPIPGQEENNANHIIACGAGVRANSFEELRRRLEELLSNSDAVAGMKRNARRCAKPQAAFAIAAATASRGPLA
jgi:processive 1,2-diacylglycerol beta-glucosyltransferase